MLPVTEPSWIVGEPCGLAPRLELDLSCRHQRRAFLFPRGYFNYRMRQPFPEYMENCLTPGALFIDIGAHFGLFSLHAAKLVGAAGRVLSFEPNPGMYASLVRSAQLNSPGTMTCADVALSDNNGETTFYLAAMLPSSSSVPEVEERQDRYTHSVQVECRRLDDYVSENNVDVANLGLIKCDVEGHEVQAVSGMIATLKAAAYPPLWIEVRGKVASTRAPNTYPRVREMLSTLGYEPHLWVGGEMKPLEGEIAERQDVAFLHEAATQPLPATLSPDEIVDAATRANPD